MALSMFIRGASTKLSGCSGSMFSVNASRFSSFTLQNASRLRTTLPIQPITASFVNIPKIQPAIFNTTYSTAAPAKAVETSSNTTLWIAERAVSVALIAVVPLAIAFPSKPLDIVLAVSLIAHTYWGFEAVISEYVRVLLFGSLIPKIAHIFLIALMMTTLGGLFYLIFDDIGFAGAIRRLWNIKPKQS